MSRIVLVTTLALFLWNFELRAQIDQDHWIPSPSNDFVNSYFRIQQEFTPTLTAIDSAQFSSGQNLMGAASTFGGPVVLNIRQGGVNGPVIAASSAVNVPPIFHGDIVFRFSEAVALVPGEIYVMEPFSPTGASIEFDVNRSGFTPAYDGGRLFYNGQFEGTDLIFREGINVPEPAPLLLLALGGVWAMVALGQHRHNHSNFRIKIRTTGIPEICGSAWMIGG